MDERPLEDLSREKWLYHSGFFDPSESELVTEKEREKFNEWKNAQAVVGVPKLRFLTVKYDHTHSIAMRSAVENNWQTDRPGTHSLVNDVHQWEFDLPQDLFGKKFHFKLVLDNTFWQLGGNREEEGFRDIWLTDSSITFGYQIQFQTNTWRPSHLLTARTSVDGPTRDIYGEFGRNEAGRWDFTFEYDQYPQSFEASVLLDRSIVANGHPITLTAANPIAYFDDGSLTFNSSPSAYTHHYENFVTNESDSERRLVRVQPRESHDFDVIVIGSGMGGGVLADALSDQGHRVLVLEAGGIRYPVHMNELPREDRSPVQRDRLGHYTKDCTDWFDGGVTFNLGGRSVYWSGLIPRMTDWEFRDVWPRSIRDYFLEPDMNGVSGYDRAENLMRHRERLGPYQDQVVDLLNTTLTDWTTTDLPRSLHQPNISKSGSITTLENVLTRSTGCFSTADLLLDSLGHFHAVGNHDLRVALHHFVTHIEHDDGVATKVVCQDLASRMERKYSAKFIVLCCGSVESPKLALNSNLTDPNSKIGNGFTDHPAYFYQRKHELPTSGPLGWLGTLDGHAKLLIRHNDASADCHPYHLEVLINARYWDVRHMDNDLQQLVTGSTEPTKVELKFIFDSELDNNNSVTTTGPDQKVKICIHPNETRKDYKSEMIEKRNEVLQALGVPAHELSNQWHKCEWSEGIKGTVHHAGGSLRCSHDGSGVVDENLKFESYENLYCCDVSVYPSIPAANPSLTLVGLAQRLAEHLSQKL